MINRIQTETNSPMRISAGILRFKDFAFILVEPYLKSSVGMNEDNAIRMKQLAMLFCLVGLPFLVCGDFNMLSGELYNSGGPSFLKAVTVDVGGALSTLRKTD